ncbi:integral membrane sensor signal transduction histidine kinase [Candidatus Magnetomorum sp. HK-1]|nr:integral membrane sensor signal transduction histidine kinase [Candidatus Magnetomorum sp. HK-1]
MKTIHDYKAVKRVILIFMIIIPSIPFILVVSSFYFSFTNSIQVNAVSNMKRIVEDHGNMIQFFLNERKANLEFVLNSFSFDEMIQSSLLKTIFENLQKESQSFIDIGVINESGVHLAYHGPYRLTGKNYEKEEWFKKVIKEGVFVSDIFLGFRRIPHFIIAIVRKDKDKTWILRATIDSYLFNNLVKSVRIGKTGESYILNAKGVFQTDRRSGGSLMEVEPCFVHPPENSQSINTFLSSDFSGVSYLYATTWLKEKEWLLVVRQEKNDAFKELRKVVYFSILIVFFCGAIIIISAFYISDRIVKKLKKTEFEKGHLKEQLIWASRLSEIGEMATGFAHEINNPLQVIKGEQTLSQMLLIEMKEKGQIIDLKGLEEIFDSLNQIGVQITRCSQITQSILNFGRQGNSMPCALDLTKYLPEVIHMIESKAKVSDIEINQDISSDIHLIKGNPGELQQVFLNLFNNAIDAIITMRPDGGGQLLIMAENSGKFVQIKVTDNGCGISDENKEKIFSPFFTTKPVGKGTGLGLSVCYGIINSMGGKMSVESDIAKGTTFTILLPESIE